MLRAFAPVHIVCLLLILASGCIKNEGIALVEWVDVPAGVYRLGSREEGASRSPLDVRLSAFCISSMEVSVVLYCRYLNESNVSPQSEHPQMIWQGGRFTPCSQREREPVAFVSYGDALGFCEWYGRISGVTVRLPSEDEWEVAARGGVRGGRYPWGWGNPDGRACYGAEEVCESGMYEPNQLGIYDMAGNLFEWCAASNASPEAPARGGSWAEEDARLLRVFHRVMIDKKYNGADMGFRIVREP